MVINMLCFKDHDLSITIRSASARYAQNPHFCNLPNTLINILLIMLRENIITFLADVFADAIYLVI